MKRINLVPLLLLGVLAAKSVGQQSPQKSYNWVQGNNEAVRLDPGYYYTGITYQADWAGKKVQVDIDAERPLTLAMVLAQDWNAAGQNPEMLRDLKYTCVQEHIMKATYACDVAPNESRILLVRDERSERGAFAGKGEAIGNHDRDQRDRDRRDDERWGHNQDRRPDYDSDRRADTSSGNDAVWNGRSPREFFAPNNVRIQYYDWACVENCNLPDPPHERVFDWVPIDNLTLRLDPNDYAAPREYGNGENMRVAIDAQQPVTVSIMRSDYWKRVNDPNPAFRTNIGSVETMCAVSRTLKAAYGCRTGDFFGPWTLIIHDERSEDRDHDRDAHGFGPASSGARAINTNSGIPAAAPAWVPVHNAADRREFASPNEVRLQYYAWRCVAYCDQPVFQWVRQVGEKYQPSTVMKIYNGIIPDHDGEQVSIKVKSPVPMAVAMLPSKVAGQLFGKPEMIESAVENSSCQQRGVESSTFQCQFNVADGPQSLVLLPEPGVSIPPKKKAQVELQAIRCVENCNKLPGSN